MMECTAIQMCYGVASPVAEDIERAVTYNCSIHVHQVAGNPWLLIFA